MMRVVCAVSKVGDSNMGEQFLSHARNAGLFGTRRPYHACAWSGRCLLFVALWRVLCAAGGLVRGCAEDECCCADRDDAVQNRSESEAFFRSLCDLTVWGHSAVCRDDSDRCYAIQSAR